MLVYTAKVINFIHFLDAQLTLRQFAKRRKLCKVIGGRKCVRKIIVVGYRDQAGKYAFTIVSFLHTSDNKKLIIQLYSITFYMQIKIYFGRFYYYYIILCPRVRDNVFIIVYTTTHNSLWGFKNINVCLAQLRFSLLSVLIFIYVATTRWQ